MKTNTLKTKKFTQKWFIQKLF